MILSSFTYQYKCSCWFSYIRNMIIEVGPSTRCCLNDFLLFFSCIHHSMLSPSTCPLHFSLLCQRHNPMLLCFGCKWLVIEDDEMSTGWMCHCTQPTSISVSAIGTCPLQHCTMEGKFLFHLFHPLKLQYLHFLICFPQSLSFLKFNFPGRSQADLCGAKL